MSADEKSVETQKTKHRSPNYPIIPVDEAIERLRLIYNADKRALTTYEAVIEHLGFATKNRSGRSARMVAALRQYGFLDEQEGHFRVSDIGWKILEMPEQSEERAQLIRRAAINPPMFRKVFRLYGGEIPSDAALRSHLIFKEKFNPDSVPNFIQTFRRTLDIANPSLEDYTDGEESDGAEQPLFGGMPMQQPPPRANQGQSIPPPPPPTGQTLPPLAAGDSVLVFKISRDSEARVIFNGQVTQEAIEKLKALLDVSKDTFPTKAELEQPQPEAPKQESQAPADELDKAFDS